MITEIMKSKVKRKCCGDCRKGKVAANHACQIKMDLEQFKNEALNVEQKEI